MSVREVNNNEQTLLLQPPNSNSAEALATACALQILAAGNFQQVQPTMPQTAPIDGAIDTSVLERTAQIIKMSSSQSPSEATSSQASILVPESDLTSFQEKIQAILKNSKYVGDVLNGVPHGRGTLTDPPINLFEYKGEWKEGKFHGEGVVTFGGNKMTGIWVNGSLEGEGIYVSVSKGKYQGTFKNSKFHGEGRFKFLDESNYTGNWENGLPHGQGTYTMSDGDHHKGHRVNGIAHGYGEYYSDGFIYKGSYAYGQYHGQGIWYSDRVTEKGEFRDGELWNGTRESGCGISYAYVNGVSQLLCCGCTLT